MPLYIPWLTETIKKRGVRYLLHHYLGQFFEEKLTLEQLSIDIYEGRGSIRDLSLDVNGLNDELDFVPFIFLDGCSIGQISVEVPWSSLATDACKVELDGAKFVCRLKTSSDASKTHCTESTLLSRSLMTSSMQMAEDIVTTEDDDECESPTSSIYRQQHGKSPNDPKKKDASQMFEGLEMFAQLIDSVLRRTKLTARNTLFQIQSHPSSYPESGSTSEGTPSSNNISDPISCHSRTESESSSSEVKPEFQQTEQLSSSEDTVEFLIKFFRCEEIMDQKTNVFTNDTKTDSDNRNTDPSTSAIPETVTKLLTLEDVEMRIGGIPVSSLIGKHTIMIKFNGQKSELSVFSGSPLLAVISHQQLKTFFKVFDSAKHSGSMSNLENDKGQKVMSSEDYAKIESQLLESADIRRGHHLNEPSYLGSGFMSSQNGRRWVDGGDIYSSIGATRDTDIDYLQANSPPSITSMDYKVTETEPSLDNIEAFSCELKLPGIWLCILRDGEDLPPLIKPYADSINSFQIINKYIDEHIKVPHIRCLALKVAFDITSKGINVFIGDLDVSEHLKNDSMKPTVHILRNDSTNTPINTPRYKARIVNCRDINIELMSRTRIVVDPTIIDRLAFDYKLFQPRTKQERKYNSKPTGSQLDLNITIKSEQFKIELLCPIPDLTPEAQTKATQLRPQSFLFDFNDIIVTLQSDKLNVSASTFAGYVKTQPQQGDEEAVKFIVSRGDINEKITFSLEPSPSNLDTEFPDDIEQALNESSLYDSIYVSQANESRIPKEAFQIKRRVVRGGAHDQTAKINQQGSKPTEFDSEKIIAPGDRQHLNEYLNQTVMSTKLSLNIHLPMCEVEFEDKEQLDLIYNRFGNDFVFWQPRAFSCSQIESKARDGAGDADERVIEGQDDDHDMRNPLFKQPLDESASDQSDRESEVSFHSFSLDGSGSDCYDNEVTCKLIIDEFNLKFNHQSCAAALRQEISVDNLLIGVVIDVNKKPGTVISLVADNLELNTETETVFEGNYFGDKNSIFALTAEIKRPTKALKDIKLAIQLVNGLFNEFKVDTYKRFWQSINVTDEPILGFVAPRIVVELHIDILNTALSLIREVARPALLCLDELYLTSMVMEKTSQIMIHMIADEVTLYLKRDRQGMEVMKNYICLIDSGLIDLDVKFSQDGRLEFGVINNVITVRVCQDSLSALCKLFNVMMRSSSDETNKVAPAVGRPKPDGSRQEVDCHQELLQDDESGFKTGIQCELDGEQRCGKAKSARVDLLEDAMNYDYTREVDSNNEGDSAKLAETTALEGDRSGSELAERAHEMRQHCERDPNACLLDESNPKLADLLSPPLLPSSRASVCDKMDDSDTMFTSNRPIDESGFFVIGDDDVGAGIIDKQQREPLVRKLTSTPIVIVDNHFKMTKPRTIPEMLAASLERYVLEEMTLVVNLYGGRDFDDENQAADGQESGGSQGSSTPVEPQASSLSESPADMASGHESGSLKSRAGSVGSVKRGSISSSRKHCSSDSSSQAQTASERRRSSGLTRRKHLSESNRDAVMSPAARVRFGEGAVNLWESLDLISAGDFLGSKRPNQPVLSADSKVSGGTWRQTDVCIQLTLSKVKLLYEVADASSPISWRFMLFIQDIEIKDRIQASDINKMLYEYCTESMPRRNTQILTVKNVATINQSDGCEECDLKVSLKPLRLNIDQDTLLFLIDFFTSLGKTLGKQSLQVSSQPSQPQPGTTTSGAAGSQQQQRSHHQSGPTLASRSRAPPTDESCRQGADTPSKTETNPRARPTASQARQQPATRPDAGEGQMPTRCHADSPHGMANQRSIYVKSFTFSPDVPIRLDYHAKHLDFEQGALAGILMGLAHLDHSELVLRRVQAKHGMRGLDRVLMFVLNSWASDIKRNQLPSILGGVGPMHSVIQLFQGMRDLVWMPIDHYRKDRRLVRGIQRGASSFSSSTAMAAINLMNRFISIVQCTAQIAHDIVTPPGLHHATGAGRRDPYNNKPAQACSSGPAGSVRLLGHEQTSASLNQPRNFCEGVAVGFTILKEGFNDTARNVAVGMQAEDVRSAVGELVRQIPSTLLSPIISATEGAQNVLVGIRNQIAPDARRDDQEKWKRRVRGK